MKENLNKLAILDGDFLLYSATMGIKCCDDTGNPILVDGKFTYTPRTEKEVYLAADDIIVSILNTIGTGDYIAYLGGEKSFRYDIYPEYKANRRGGVKPPFINELRYYLKGRWGFEYTKHRLEADDAVNIARNRYSKEYDCYIVTSDKDLIKSIPGKYYNVSRQEIVETDKLVADSFFWCSMIAGDSIDNIKGLPGKGISFATKLLSNNKLWYHTNLMAGRVFQLYIDTLGIIEGIREYNKHYKLLKMLDDHPDFETPQIMHYKFKEGDNKWEETESHIEPLW